MICISWLDQTNGHGCPFFSCCGYHGLYTFSVSNESPSVSNIMIFKSRSKDLSIIFNIQYPWLYTCRGAISASGLRLKSLRISASTKVMSVVALGGVGTLQLLWKLLDRDFKERGRNRDDESVQQKLRRIRVACANSRKARAIPGGIYILVYCYIYYIHIREYK